MEKQQGAAEQKASILFVDDEPAILNGLRNLLRKKRNIWNMHFAEGAQQALSVMVERKFDVVVTDMRMPQMDGAALLAKIRELYPGTVRIILSGHTEASAIMRAVPVAHQFLSKPCDPDRLHQAIEKSLELIRRLAAESVRSILGLVDKLPVLPEVYHELVALMNDENSSAAQVARVVERDPAISAKLLQLVNSAFFGLPQHIASVERAVTQLGMSSIYSLVVSSAIFELFSSPEQSFSMVDFQKHALVTSRLAKNMVNCNIDETLVAGLLHDLGKLILLKQAPDAFRAISSKKQNSAASWQDLEMELLGCTHAELGASLLDLWSIPTIVVEAVACHHRPESPAMQQMEASAAVYLANELINGRKPDEKFLSRLALADKLNDWQTQAAKLLGRDK